MEPWAAEVVVSPELARDLIAAQFPDLAGETVTPLGQGWDNTVVRAGGWVFRFPRRQIAVDCLEHELAVLPRIAPALPLAVTVPERVGRPAPRYPWPFAGCRLIPGRPAEGLDDATRAGLAAPLGRFLRALHSLPPGDAPPDTIGRTDVAKRAARGRERLAAVSLDPDDRRALERIFAETPPDLPRPPPVIVHGDLYARHLMVDGGRATGVIDWGDVHAGDPAIDLALVWTFLPPPARADFFTDYGEIDAATATLARFRAAYHTLNLIVYAEGVGDGSLARESRSALAALSLLSASRSKSS